jgi:hypothetical protein
VVIGILIALNINNWKEERLERKEEKKLLQNLKIDFQQTIDALNEMNSFRDTIISANYALTKIKAIGDYSNEQVIDSLLGRTFVVPTFNGKTGSLMALLNSGKINLISNESLKSLLFYWPQEVEDMTEGEIDSKKLTNENYLPILRKHVLLTDMFSKKNVIAIVQDTESKTTKDYMSLFNEIEFENLLTQIELLSKDNTKETNNLIGIAGSIIEIINSELQNK